MSWRSRRVGLLGHDEAEPAGVRREPPDDEVHLLGQAEAIAADLQQFAGGDQRLQLPLEAGALLAGHAQHLHQLARGGGMMDVLANLSSKKIVSHCHHLTADRE